MGYNIEDVFKYHPPKPGQSEKYDDLRAKAKELAHLMGRWCPESRELSVARTKLEESLFWANASVARNT